MVIRRREIKRKRKETGSACSLLDDSPKRTKVHAQRKFAQGSNVSSPVITPVKEIEKQEKLRPDTLPEPQELLPMNRPHTEDFLTFLCFRGTSMLPPSLNFFNTAPIDSRVHTQPLKAEPIEVCPPLANLSTKTQAGTSERPFIAFGVRKRADPILVSKHMDKKRRHALALQALRRKYQEQKMAKIRAVTISKLSEKTTSKSLVRTRSVTKNETTTNCKKSITQKTRVKIVATKHVRVTTRSSIKTPIRTTLNAPIRTQIQKRMCLRSFRGRFIQRELKVQTPKKKKPGRDLKKQQDGDGGSGSGSGGGKTEGKKKKETSSEFSSDDDQPLVKTVKVKPSSKVAKKCTAASNKKPIEVSYRVTRASRPLLTTTREQTVKRKIQISRTLPTKSPFVKLTPPKSVSPRQKQKEENVRVMKTRKSEKSESPEKTSDTKPQEGEVKVEKEQKKKQEDKKRLERSPPARKAEKVEASPEKDLKKKVEITAQKDTAKKKSSSEVVVEKDVLKKKLEVDKERECKKKLEISLEKDLKKKAEVVLEKDLKKKPEDIKNKSEDNKKLEINIEKDLSEKAEAATEKDKKLESNPEKVLRRKSEVTSEKDKKTEANVERDLRKKAEINPEKDKQVEINMGKDLRKKTETNADNKDVQKKAETSVQKDLKKIEVSFETDMKKKMETKKNPEVVPEKDVQKKTESNMEKDMKKKLEVILEKDLKKISTTDVNINKEPKKKPENADKEIKKKVSSKVDEIKQKSVEENSPEEENEANIEKKQKNKLDVVTENKTELTKEKKKPEKTDKSDKPDKIEVVLLEKDATKRNPRKSETTLEKKKPKNETVVAEEPKVSQRPTRKTKEAAAIYMELLGHKLVSECYIDDDSISIDSFPELPNVRKTEQRENELKAKAKSKGEEKITLKPKQVKTEESAKKKEMENKNKAKDIFSDSDLSLKKSKKKNNLPKQDAIEIAKRTTRGSLLNRIVLSSESGESETEIVLIKEKKQSPIKMADSSIIKTSVQTRLQTFNESSSESDESTTSKKTNQIKNLGKTKRLKRTSAPRLDNSFSDSDEEPLSKLTLSKSKQDLQDGSNKTILKRKSLEHNSNIRKEPIPKQAKKDNAKTQEKKKPDKSDSPVVDEHSTLVSTKPKRECTKKPQNYLTLFSSSEDEERFFHGFVKNESTKPTKSLKEETSTKCPQTTSADLLCKDVDKRFGKGKVNMSTEQIEKWLKESALAGSPIKKGYDEKNSHLPETSLDLTVPARVETNIKKAEIIEPPRKAEKAKIEPKLALTTKPIEHPLLVSSTNKPTERKTIFRKERKIYTPSINAFSANNESSVYAFEADNEDAISTPFRRPTRRPSSTATSRSEDSSKYEESSKTATTSKFRLPSARKQDVSKSTNKQQVSVMLSTDESNTSTSIAVQLDLDSTEVFPEPVITQAETEGNEQLFYIPLQPGKQSASQLIQGVAVKLGTKGANGPNQRVVMSAKLVTHTPLGAQKLTEKPQTPPSTTMYPPSSSTIQKSKLESCQKTVKSTKPCDRTSETSEELKYKIPSSPSASSSSSTKITNKRQHMKTRIRPSVEFLNPINSNEFPACGNQGAALLEAPVFYPNEKEFQDPLEYIEKIKPHAEKFGICRIVPPSNFKPECKVTDDMRFTAYNQYVHKMLHRWGPNFKELMAITKYLKTQNIALTHPPWIGGMEIDLPRLYQIVQSLGGLKEVIEKKRWPKVSELMKIPKSAQDRVTKLDDIYCKYLLPYDTLSPDEREKLFDEVETDWAKRESRGLLQSQQKIGNRDASPNSESDSDDESEECIVKGRNMALNAFYRIARNTMSMWFKTVEPSAQEVEQEFWKHVTLKQNHICVHSGSIDSGNWGYGFSVMKNSPFARHAWNLKVLTNNSGSVLRYMAPVMGVTVPTLHVGMVFSACCWYRDPHSLPWIEYLHTGGNKIWYGIPDSMSQVFHSALVKLVPNYCRNKSLWLPSDTAMVPPSLLVENGVSLCRTIQEPGQFIVVFPKAFTSSLCTGYVVSESVYFAPLSWLTTAQKVFDELQDSCEPSMFSLEKLFVSITQDGRTSVDVLRQIIPALELLREKEILAWKKLQELGLNEREKLPLPEAPIKKRKKLQNDSGDYECEICCKNLFISWVFESQEFIYCLEHAIEYIEKKKLEIKNCKLTYTFNSEELKNLIEKVKSTIEMKLQKKASGKST